MSKNIFFHFFLVFAISTRECTNLPSLKFTRELNDEVDASEKNNETDVFQKLMDENSTKAMEDDSLFWTINPTTEENVTETGSELINEKPTVPDVSTEEGTTDVDSKEIVSLDTETPPKVNDSLEGNKKPENSPVLSDLYQMKEKIILPRNNCNLELAVDETEDTKIQIKFEPLHNNTAGKCYVTINGRENNMLGVLLTDIHLYRNYSEGELLEVIVTNSGMTFVLKQYDGRSNYQPLLLTETHKVYIVLHYNVTNVIINDSSRFNLEVFSYHKYENLVDDVYHGGSMYSTSSVKHDVENIFLTTQQPPFSFPAFLKTQ